MLLVSLHQLDGGIEDPRLARAAAELEAMRDQLRGIEHGLQEANDLGDTTAFDCVKTGHLGIAHQVESAEQWSALLTDAVGSDEPERAARLLDRIVEAHREVDRRAAQLATCRLDVAPPEPPINRSWFGCADLPPDATNPAWSACERRRTSIASFGLGGFLLAAPVASLVTLGVRSGSLTDWAGLALESAAGGLIGALAAFAVSGAIALAVTQALDPEKVGPVGPALGLCTALGVGAGAITGMWLDHPTSGRAAPVAAAVSYVVLAGVSALLIALHDHFGIAGTSEESLAEKSFFVAPALMAISAMVTVPAAWSLFARH
jgi:hypothetical protein